MGRLTLLGAGVPSVGFNPITLGDVQGFWEADSGITLNGTTVSQWNDKSGYNRHLKQSAATSQPLFVANSINGTLPSLLFDGSNDSLALDASVLGFGNMTFFIVLKRTNNNSHAVLTNGAATYMYLQYGNNFYIGNNIKAAAMTNGVWYLRGGTGKNDGTGTRYYSNNVDLGTVAGGTNVFDAFRYVGTAGGAFLAANVYGILLVSRVLNSTEIGQVNGYFNNKLAIY
jgi:hypothetical protein